LFGVLFGTPGTAPGQHTFVQNTGSECFMVIRPFFPEDFILDLFTAALLDNFL
jgi:hypothetical protein